MLTQQQLVVIFIIANGLQFVNNNKKGGEKVMKGKDIRKLIIESGLKLWQVAEKLNMNDGNFSRKLRGEFTPDEVSAVKEIIKEIKGNN